MKHGKYTVQAAMLTFFVLASAGCAGTGPAQAGTALSTAQTTEDTPYMIPAADNGKAALTALSALNASYTENSHAEAQGNAYLEADYNSYIELSSASTGQTRYDKAYYARIKQLKDGSYILFWMYSVYGQHVYWATSSDMKVWSAPQVLYNSADYKFASTYSDTGEDRVYFANCDAVVLQNGDILTVTAFRACKGYKNTPEQAGIYLRRSTDNGKTWGEPQKIYTGLNWEPYIMELSSGRIQVFFSQVSPGIVYWGEKTDRNSTGTGTVWSDDGGVTWEPYVTSSPWQAKIAFQQYVLEVEGSPSFTDQMPAAAELFDGTVAAVCESKTVDKAFCISLIHSDALWSETVEYNKTGPADRTNNFIESAGGPYIVKMPTGETVISFNQDGSLCGKLGSGDARAFGGTVTLIDGPGNWGCIEVTGACTLTAAFARAGAKNSIALCSYYLNHAITAKPAGIVVNGKNTEDWKDNDGALFVGGESEIQLTMRAAVNGDMLYLLLERHDSTLAPGGMSYAYLADTAGSFIRFAVDNGGNVTMSRGAGNSYTAVDTEFEYASSAAEGTDGGMITEIGISLDALGLSGRASLRAALSLTGRDTDGRYVSDKMDGTDLYDAGTWVDIILSGHESGGAALALGESAARTVCPAPELGSAGGQSLYVFDNLKTVEDMVSNTNGTEVSFADEGYMTVTVTDPADPWICVDYGDINADTEKYMIICMRERSASLTDGTTGIFFSVGDMDKYGYTAAKVTQKATLPDGEWHTYVIDMTDKTDFGFYTGTLNSIRIDPFDNQHASEGDALDIAWIALTGDSETAFRFYE